MPRKKKKRVAPACSSQPLGARGPCPPLPPASHLGPRQPLRWCQGIGEEDTKLNHPPAGYSQPGRELNKKTVASKPPTGWNCSLLGMPRAPRKLCGFSTPWHTFCLPLYLQVLIGKDATSTWPQKLKNHNHLLGCLTLCNFATSPQQCLSDRSQHRVGCHQHHGCTQGWGVPCTRLLC